MVGTEFPLWSIGTVNGIEAEYDVHWLEWDRAQLSIDGEEIVTFSSASSTGFQSKAQVLQEASDVVFEIEDEEWD